MKPFLYVLLILPFFAFSRTLEVGQGKPYATIKTALEAAQDFDRILVHPGHYTEGLLEIRKPIQLIGVGRPVLDGEFKSELVAVYASNVHIEGFKFINSGKDEIRSVAAVHLYQSHDSVIRQNIFENNYFGIYVQASNRCLIEHNKLTTNRSTSQEMVGDGIHLLGSREIWVKNNYISGHKDGIYLEKSRQCFLFKNLSRKNLRYGLHFMFSNESVYTGNVFDNNGAGVAVMYAMNVQMYNNHFINNWGDSSYGILLKEISYSKIKGNHFENNTTGVYADGATKIDFYENTFANNGWGLKINANCMENKVIQNDFIGNTFDVSTNGSVVLNKFNQNYWDKYEGYDLDKNKVGDIPYHPLSLYALLVDQNPSIMLLYRTFFVDLLNRTEKIIPSLTPENFVDDEPLLKPVRS